MIACGLRRATPGFLTADTLLLASCRNDEASLWRENTGPISVLGVPRQQYEEALRQMRRMLLRWPTPYQCYSKQWCISAPTPLTTSLMFLSSIKYFLFWGEKILLYR